ncbi:MAG: hypothetical protein AB7G88_13730, partial [Thermomicrobiales bacterium]
SAKAALIARIAQSSPSSETPATGESTSLEAYRTPALPAAPVVPEMNPRSSETSGVPFSNPWSRFISYAAPLATLPLILALGFVGYWGVSARMDLDDRNETVSELNATVQLLNSKVESLSVGMEDFEEYLNPDTSKHYAMLDPSPSAEGTQAYGLLLTNAVIGDAVVMAWRLDPSVVVYEVVIQWVDGESTIVADLFTDADGDAMRRIDLGGPLAEIDSIHIRPKTTGFSNDSNLNTSQPDALSATIWPGLNGLQDTIPLQTYP